MINSMDYTYNIDDDGNSDGDVDDINFAKKYHPSFRKKGIIKIKSKFNYEDLSIDNIKILIDESNILKNEKNENILKNNTIDIDNIYEEINIKTKKNNNKTIF